MCYTKTTLTEREVSPMTNPLYKYEMHIHTSPCSGGGSDIRDHIDTLIQKE